MMKIGVEGAPCLVEQINIPTFPAPVSDMHPPNFRSDMSMLQQEVCNITHTTPRPIPEREQRFSPQIVCLFDQGLEKSTLLFREDTWGQDLLGWDFYTSGRI